MEAETLPYQPHSATSKEAAERNVTAAAIRTRVFNLIHERGKHGATADEIASALNKIPNMISSRLHELEVGGFISRLSETRLTRSRRAANVYVVKDQVHGREVLPVKQGSTVMASRLEAAHKIIDMLREVTPIADFSPMFQVRFKKLCEEAGYVYQA